MGGGPLWSCFEQVPLRGPRRSMADSASECFMSSPAALPSSRAASLARFRIASHVRGLRYTSRAAVLSIVFFALVALPLAAVSAHRPDDQRLWGQCALVAPSVVLRNTCFGRIGVRWHEGRMAYD